ncbi:MAG: ion transporter [Deferribacteres bacterium]|nr:ion transporter [candidate division KSB1 bacterium]MCB9502436.1 ion transporter [Deferribacteres bacterium]
MREKQKKYSWRAHLHEIIFEADTPAGRLFDVVLIIFILLSIVVVSLDSVRSLRMYAPWFRFFEWFFTLVFTVEYILRILTTGKPLAYVRSFFGVIDLLAILPTYISLLFPGTHYLLVIRSLRVLRVFRVLKLVQYLKEATMLLQALRASRRKITVFLFGVLSLVLILGSMMYIIEGEKSGFTSIPRSVYWAIVTLTTVGYGDIAPASALGQALAAFIMILGYCIIAVPTGIVSVELTRSFSEQRISTQACPECSAEGHDYDAVHCKYCGARL